MAGEATSAAALRFSSSSSSSSVDEGAGLAVVGCVDGSLHVFSLDSGVRALPPVVLGAAVACVDVVEAKDEGQQLQGQEQGQSGVAIVAMTIDGELWVWRKRGVTMICSCRCSVKSEGFRTAAQVGSKRGAAPHELKSTSVCVQTPSAPGVKDTQRS